MTKWIKICGVTTVDDATMIAAAGASAIGLNCYPKSKRYLAAAAARQIRDSVAAELDVVGVFVNSAAAEVAKLAEDIGLNAVQFHGDESTVEIIRFHEICPDVAIIRAFRIGAEGLTTLQSTVTELVDAGVPLAAVLVDAFVEGEYGGTGHQVDAKLLQDWPGHWPRLILSGGLTPETAAAAAAAVNPWGVDTASGIELSPGIKCPSKVRQFVDVLAVDASCRLSG